MNHDDDDDDGDDVDGGDGGDGDDDDDDDDDDGDGYRRGVQSRSRSILAHANVNNKPCPTRLWDSQSCDSEFCMSFNWRTEVWQKNHHRSVWCERSDGLRVEGFIDLQELEDLQLG
ncbi:hypothetical protein KUTeg_015448, partial [Tegillarca granosa]